MRRGQRLKGQDDFVMRGSNVSRRRRMSAKGHLLSHKQNKLPVLFIGLAQQTAELAQIPRIFA